VRYIFQFGPLGVGALRGRACHVRTAGGDHIAMEAHSSLSSRHRPLSLARVPRGVPRVRRGWNLKHAAAARRRARRVCARGLDTGWQPADDDHRLAVISRPRLRGLRFTPLEYLRVHAHCRACHQEVARACGKVVARL
jgi:hypothetical protein